jgi:hypothetical protein
MNREAIEAMHFQIRSIRAAAILGALLTLAAVSAPADPLFGPEVYVRTTGSPDVYNDGFASATAGPAYLWVLNGDAGGSRVSSGSIVFNGKTVAGDADFSKTSAYFIKPVTRLAGANALTVTLQSDPGSFITVVIVRAGLPDISVGRLIVPWTASANLVLDLKNGSHANDRNARVVVYDASGAVQAFSDRLLLSPAGAISNSAASLLTNGSNPAWTEGSIEVFYAGRGPARLFGQSVQTDATTTVQTIVNMQHAGHRRIDPFRQTPDAASPNE